MSIWITSFIEHIHNFVKMFDILFIAVNKIISNELDITMHMIVSQ